MNSKRIITTYKKLQKQDGEVVCIQGVFSSRKEKKAFSTNRLILEDGTEIVLPPKISEKLPNLFKNEYDEKRMLICGNVFIREIPKKYNIIGRKSHPYLLDLSFIELNDE